jgi:hypothetical protein
MLPLFAKRVLSQRSGKLVFFNALWFAAICFGFFALLRYESRPGEGSVALRMWPVQSKLPLNENLPTLVLFAHPKCPCTRATLGELALLLARCSHKVVATVVFTKPEDVDDNWVETDLWRSAEAIPGVSVLRDDSGVEARRFGAVTSGDVMLYARDGKLLFHGGITDARGHAGDNEGRTAIALLLEGKPGNTKTTHVFGCRLFADHSDQPSRSTCPP